MDDKKVIVIGSGTLGLARLLGEALHDSMKSRGEAIKPILIEADFSELETRISGMFDAVLEDGTAMVDIMTGRIYTGRDIYREPEMQHLPRRKLKALDDVAHANHLFAKGYDPSLMIWDEFGYPEQQKPADHPSRKREPKGPRGKWGKL